MLAVSNDYIGEIVDANLQESDDGKMGAVVLVRPDNAQEVGRWFGSFSETVIDPTSKSRNAGRMVGEVTAETLGEFGCTDFSRIDALIGMKCKFGVKHTQDKKDPEKIWVEVNFIRPLRAKPASASGLASINKFRGAALAAAKGAPKPPAKPSTGNGGRQREMGDDTEAPKPQLRRGEASPDEERRTRRNNLIDDAKAGRYGAGAQKWAASGSKLGELADKLEAKQQQRLEPAVRQLTEGIGQ